MLQEIKLDDRKYQDIRDDAVENIVKHCPEWTNHNASDPGITIIELLSSMSEDIIDRLNQVPDKNYLAFLDLVGISQRLPRPSRTQVSFTLSGGYQDGLAKKDTILVPKGSTLSTDPQGAEEPILFETVKDLKLSNAKLLNIYSKTFNTYRQRDDIVDNMASLKEEKPFTPFSMNGSSDNIVQIYFSSNKFDVFTYSANISLIFRLPTTMRLHNIKDNFLENVNWEFYNGLSWQKLNIIHDHILVLDDKDADILSVTFTGENEEFTQWLLDRFDSEDNYHLRGTIEEAPSWLKDFEIYEAGILTSSFDGGVLPSMAFHNDENLNLNNDFYPFGNRPKIDDRMKEEIFYLNSDEAFEISQSNISLKFKQSLSPEYILAKSNNNLKLVWEYPVGISKWNLLKVVDTTKLFTKDGEVVFSIPDDMIQIELNGEEGYWIRCRIADGDYGADEKSEYNEKTGTVISTKSTLRPPVFSAITIHYSKPREDIKSITILNNFKYKEIAFRENLSTKIFDIKPIKEEAMFFAFDSFISEDSIAIFFDIENETKEKNIYTEQRVLEWQLLQNGEWIKLQDVEDNTDGLTLSGDVIIELPLIEKLEKNTLYIEEYERMWIKAKVKFNTLKSSPSINNILLNSVDVVQQETFYDELIGRSDGLPDLKFKLNYNNLVAPPQMLIGDEEFVAVERFIDQSKEAKVFRFNGIDGVIAFGDGEYGEVPKLGENITVKEYSITEGKKGNVNIGEISIIRESINYIDSVINYKISSNGEDGDSLNDLKKHAPTVLKTMNRAISTEDYELLCQNFSPAIKRAKCISKDGDVIIVPLTETIIKDKGFINKSLLDDLKFYLKERSLLTVNPQLIPPTIVTLDIYLELLYTVENYNVSKIDLQNAILSNANTYFNPLTGYKGEGFPIGKLINKGDFYAILQQTDNNIFINEIKFSINNSKNLVDRVNLSHYELPFIESIVVEELSYDI